MNALVFILYLEMCKGTIVANVTKFHLIKPCLGSCVGKLWWSQSRSEKVFSHLWVRRCGETRVVAVLAVTAIGRDSYCLSSLRQSYNVAHHPRRQGEIQQKFCFYPHLLLQTTRFPRLSLPAMNTKTFKTQHFTNIVIDRSIYTQTKSPFSKLGTRHWSWRSARRVCLSCAPLL